VLAAYVAGGQAGEVPAVMEAMKVGARLPQFHLCVQWEFGAAGVLASRLPLILALALRRACRFLPRTASRLPSMLPAAWWRRAACRKQRSSCSWQCGSVSMAALFAGLCGRWVNARQCCATLGPSAGLNLDQL
jgi:hypothetical protein